MWIELHQSLWTHKKTIIMAAHLDIDEIYAAAHMSKLWTWALDNAPDGDLSGLPDRVIAFGAGWKGDATSFTQALIKSGWIDREGDQTIIHDWYDYAGKLIEKRASDTERKRKSRQKKDVRRTSDGHPSDGAGTLPNLTVPKEGGGNAPAREEDSKTTFQIVEEHFGIAVNPVQMDNLEKLIDSGLDPDIVQEAALITKKKSKSIDYFWGILDRCQETGVLTIQAFREAENQYQQAKKANSRGQPKSKQDRANEKLMREIMEGERDGPNRTQEDFSGDQQYLQRVQC